MTLVLTLPVVGCQRSMAQKIDTVFFEDGDGWDIKEPFVEDGRTVLLKHVAFFDGDTHVMTYYILPHTDAKHQERVSLLFGDPNRIDEMAHEEHDQMCAEAGSPYIHVDLGDMPTEFFQVVCYKGKYYLSVDNTASIFVTDSALIIHGMEDWMEQLRSVVKNPDGSFTIELRGWNYEKRAVDNHTVMIPAFDEEKHLYDFDNYNKYWKFTTREHLKDFDLIDIDNWFELYPLKYDYD